MFGSRVAEREPSYLSGPREFEENGAEDGEEEDWEKKKEDWARMGVRVRAQTKTGDTGRPNLCPGRVI